MIAGLPLEYAATRSAARLAQRPGEPLWRQWHAARALPVLVDAVRTSSAAPWIGGIGLAAPHADIEPAFRMQMRSRIAEVAGWAPDDWRTALRWTQRLIDLPLAVHLAAGGKAPGWVGDDPRAADRQFDGWPTAATPAPALPMQARADQRPSQHAAQHRERRESHLHPALLAWLDAWRALWPPCSDEDRAALEELVAVVARHLHRFAAAAPEDAAALRTELQARLLALQRRHPARPVALFAALALHALDLERLRAEFVLRAWFADGATR